MVAEHRRTNLQLIEPRVHAAVAEQADEVQGAVLEGLPNELEPLPLVYLPGRERQIDQLCPACAL